MITRFGPSEQQIAAMRRSILTAIEQPSNASRSTGKRSRHFRLFGGAFGALLLSGVLVPAAFAAHTEGTVSAAGSPASGQPVEPVEQSQAEVDAVLAELAKPFNSETGGTTNAIAVVNKRYADVASRFAMDPKREVIEVSYDEHAAPARIHAYKDEIAAIAKTSLFPVEISANTYNAADLTALFQELAQAPAEWTIATFGDTLSAVGANDDDGSIGVYLSHGAAEESSVTIKGYVVHIYAGLAGIEFQLGKDRTPQWIADTRFSSGA